VRVTRYLRGDADEAPDPPVRQWLLAGGLLDSLPWQFSESRYGWAATYERDGLRIDVIRPRLPARAADGAPEQNLPLTTAFLPEETRQVASIDCTGRVAMCRNVFGDHTACGGHTVGSVHERSFTDLWSSPVFCG
jgi:hypothetical protein